MRARTTRTISCGAARHIHLGESVRVSFTRPRLDLRARWNTDCDCATSANPLQRRAHTPAPAVNLHCHLTLEVSGVKTRSEATKAARPLDRLVRRLACWWFGCAPDYDHPCELAPNYVVPCVRCGAHETSYADRVGDTRHNRAKEWLRYWCLRRWLPARCTCCGKRFGEHPECLPF